MDRASFTIYKDSSPRCRKPQSLASCRRSTFPSKKWPPSTDWIMAGWYFFCASRNALIFNACLPFLSRISFIKASPVLNVHSHHQDYTARTVNGKCHADSRKPRTFHFHCQVDIRPRDFGNHEWNINVVVRVNSNCLSYDLSNFGSGSSAASDTMG